MKILLVLLIYSFQIIIYSQVAGDANYGNAGAQTINQKSKAKALEKLKKDPGLYKVGDKVGETKKYRGEFLNAIDFHTGSIGGGAIRLNGKGQLHRWQIFNNLTELALPDSFFAVYAENENKQKVVRTLDTVGKGKFQSMDSLIFTGEFPFANYYFQDKKLPLGIRMEVYSPFIPLDTKNSVLPVVIFNFTITNTSNQKQKVSLLQSQQNAVGYSPIHEYAKGSWNNDFIFEKGKVILKPHKSRIKGIYHASYNKNYNQTVFSKNKVTSYLKSKISKNALSYGDMAVLLMGENKGKEKLTAKSSWQNIENLYNEFSKKGFFSETKNTVSATSKKGETYNTALSINFTLKPGESKKITAIIAWHFPNGKNGGINNKKWSATAWGGVKRGKKWGGIGNYYENYWTNSAEVLDYAYQNLLANEKKTRLFHSTIYDMSLPHWMKDRFTSQLPILNSKTVFWTQDGYFGGWEGTGPGDGSCAGNCNHVWHYAQAQARLFPDTSRFMTEQLFHYQKKNGAVPYRQPDNRSVSADSQFTTILQAYRQHLLQTNNDWLKKNFCNIKKAMKYAIQKWDKDRDGRLSGSQHTTLDCNISGNSSWIGSLYAAALYSMHKMAIIYDRENDSDENNKLALEYKELADKAVAIHQKELWNGEYFNQIPDQRMLSDYKNGSAIDQLLGQWWAYQVNLGDMYSTKKMKKAMSSVFKYNFRPNFYGIKQVPREFVKDFQAGMQMITWPKNNRPKGSTTYADEVMSGFEYSTIAMMLSQGLKEESFIALKAIYDRYNGKLYTGYKGAWGNWGYSGNPFGDDECGKMYSRALSVWSILLAYQGFMYDGPNQMIGFLPPLKEKKHRSFFSTAMGWGEFQQIIKEKSQQVTLKVLFGNLSLKKMMLTSPVKKVKSIFLKGKKLKFNQQEKILEISLGNLNLTKGQQLSLKISF